jgi:hypothetical protein
MILQAYQRNMDEGIQALNAFCIASGLETGLEKMDVTSLEQYLRSGQQSILG